MQLKEGLRKVREFEVHTAAAESFATRRSDEETSAAPGDVQSLATETLTNLGEALKSESKQIAIEEATDSKASVGSIAAVEEARPEVKDSLSGVFPPVDSIPEDSMEKPSQQLSDPNEEL